MRKVILTLNILLILSSVPVAICQLHLGEVADVEYGVLGSANGGHNPTPLYVLLAYDEEIATATYGWFGTDVDGHTYVLYQTMRGLWRFPTDMFNFKFKFVQWDSDDSATLEEAILEVEEELGWCKGMVYEAQWMSLLVAWTGQNNDVYAGCAHLGSASCINTIQTDWTDDNTVQEEVTHLFGIDTHCTDDGCVMSVLQRFYGYINENLQPIEERTMNWIPVWNTQSVGVVSHGWCETHYSQLLESGGNPDIIGNGMFAHPKINPVNPPPEEKPKINPTNPWVPWFIFAIGMAAFMVIAVYVYKRKRKKQREYAESVKYGKNRE